MGLSIQAFTAIISTMSLFAVVGALWFGYRSYLKAAKNDLRDAINDIGEEGLDSNTKLEPHFSEWQGGILSAKETYIDIHFYRRASVAGGSSITDDELRADNSPWTLATVDFADDRHLYHRLERVDSVRSASGMKKFGFQNKQIISFQLTTVDPSECAKSLAKIIEIIREEFNRDEPVDE
jgi:hypothetical protein